VQRRLEGPTRQRILGRSLEETFALLEVARLEQPQPAVERVVAESVVGRGSCGAEASLTERLLEQYSLRIADLCATSVRRPPSAGSSEYRATSEGSRSCPARSST